jgi:hypothetical protein
MQSCGTWGDPSQQAVEVLGEDLLQSLLEAQSHGAVADLGEQGLHASRVLRPELSSGGTKPAGLCLMFPVEQWELWDLLTHGCCFPWSFKAKVAGYVLEESMEF